MKVGDKYLIEIGEILTDKEGNELAKIKGFNSLVFDQYGLDKLIGLNAMPVYSLQIGDLDIGDEIVNKITLEKFLVMGFINTVSCGESINCGVYLTRVAEDDTIDLHTFEEPCIEDYIKTGKHYYQVNALINEINGKSLDENLF